MDINIKALMAVVLSTLTNKTVLANTVNNTKDVVKNGRLGDGVDVYVDILADVTAKTYTAANKAAQADYDFDALNLDTVNVKLDNELYAAVEIDGWDTLVITADNLQDYIEFGVSLAKKLARQVEVALGAVINATTNKNVAVVAANRQEKGEAIIDQIMRDKLVLDNAGVDSDERFLVAGEELSAVLLSTKDILNVDKSDSPEALRNAVIGRIGGFTVLSSSTIASTSYVAYHPSAYTLASREPGKNITAEYSEVVSDASGSVDLRFNILSLGRRNATGLIVSTFFTAKDIDSANRAVKRTFNFSAPTA